MSTDVHPDRVTANYATLITLEWLRLGRKSRGKTLEGEMLNMIINLAIREAVDTQEGNIREDSPIEDKCCIQGEEYRRR